MDRLALIIVVSSWAASFVVAKATLDRVPPMTLSLLRFAVASVFLAALRPGTFLKPVSRESLGRLALLGFLGVSLQFTLQYTGMRYTTSAHASLMFAASPVFIAILGAFWLKERVTRRTAAGLAVALVGVAVVVLAGTNVSPATTGAPRAPWATVVGDLLLLMMAAAWAWYSVLSRDLSAEFDSYRATAWTTVLGTLMLVPPAAWEVARQGWPRLGPGDWMAVAYLGVIASGIGYVLWVRGVERLGSARAGIYMYLQPVLTVAMGWTFLGERLGFDTVAGAALVLFGTWMSGKG